MPAHPFTALRRLRYRCHIDIFNGTAIRGWIFPIRDPQAASLVIAYYKGKPVSLATETVHRSDLTAIGWGPVAFTLSLTAPASLNSVDLRVARPSRPKQWSTVERSIVRSTGRGALDGCSEDKVRGWAASFESDDGAFEILIYAGSEVVTRTRPYLPRPDAADALALRDTRIGFETSLPWRHSAFDPLAVVGNAKDKQFPIGEIKPKVMENDVFTQSFHFDPGSGFWR